MTLFKLGKDLDRDTADYIKERTHRVARETPLPGTAARQQGRAYPGCDQPRLRIGAWLRKSLGFKVS